MAQMYQTSLAYKFLRVYTNLIYSTWYSSTEVNGEYHVPQDASVIFAPCHQNAFIDAMALLWASPSPIVFLAKAGIFTNKIVKSALNGLKIMPAYRMRDGYANLKKNEESFNEAVKVLAHNEYFCLMPEGGQDEKRRLRPLVKGMFRIAFAAQKQKPEGESVYIVPTGLDYGHYDKSGHHLVVNFGKPIRVADYMDQYEENEAVTQNRLRDELYSRMKPLMLHIASEKYYDTFYAASYAANTTMLQQMEWDDNETNRLEMRQRIVNGLEKAEEEANPKLTELAAAVSEWMVKSDDPELLSIAYDYGRKCDMSLILSTALLLFGFPVFCIAFVLSGLPWLGFKAVAYKIAHGTGFEGSFKLGLSYVVLPFIQIAEALLFFALVFPHFESWPLMAAFVVSLPLSFRFLMNYSQRYRHVKARLQNIFTRHEAADRVCSIVRELVPLDMLSSRQSKS